MEENRRDEEETHDVSLEAVDAMRQAALSSADASAPDETANDVVFEPNMALRLVISGSDIPIVLSPSEQECVLGRRDPVAGDMPDVDLSPYAAFQMGLSRRHAAIRLASNRLYVWDMGSKNGTFLNGKKLQALKPHMVRSGDELRCGKMVIKLYFE